MTKNKNDTYDKIMGKNNLFSDSTFDEMQRVESYRIGFKVFRVSFFLHLILSFAMLAAGEIIEDPPLALAGSVYLIFSMVTYLVYGAMTSAKGIMAPEMVKAYRSPLIAVIWGVLAVVWVLKCVVNKEMYITAVCWLFLCVYHASMCLLARRSERALKKQLEETDDENDDSKEE